MSSGTDILLKNMCVSWNRNCVSWSQDTERVSIGTNILSTSVVGWAGGQVDGWMGEQVDGQVGLKSQSSRDLLERSNKLSLKLC